MHHDIANWFLILSLFFPRLTLFIAWLNDGIPANNIPFWGDVVMAIIIPRVLICIYIAENMGTASGWFILHVVVALLVFLGAGSKCSR